MRRKHKRRRKHRPGNIKGVLDQQYEPYIRTGLGHGHARIFVSSCGDYCGDTCWGRRSPVVVASLRGVLEL